MNEKKFIELYHRQKESGLTVKEFCSNEIMAPSTFYHWQKKLKSRKRLPDFIPVFVGPAPALSQVNLTGRAHSSGTVQANDSTHIEIEFANKTIVRIKSGLDLSMLKALIHLND
jgi:hypothetical protein